MIAKLVSTGQHRRAGKGPALADAAAGPAPSADDVEIEIVEVKPDAEVRAEETKKVALVPKMTRADFNRSLRKMAEKQMMERREEEEAEMLARAEARRRKREERKAMKHAENQKTAGEGGDERSEYEDNDNECEDEDAPVGHGRLRKIKVA